MKSVPPQIGYKGPNSSVLDIDITQRIGTDDSKQAASSQQRQMEHAATIEDSLGFAPLSTGMAAHDLGSFPSSVIVLNTCATLCSFQATV